MKIIVFLIFCFLIPFNLTGIPADISRILGFIFLLDFLMNDIFIENKFYYSLIKERKIYKLLLFCSFYGILMGILTKFILLTFNIIESSLNISILTVGVLIVFFRGVFQISQQYKIFK